MTILEYEHGVEVDRGVGAGGQWRLCVARARHVDDPRGNTGDLIVVQPQDRADNGDFVVAGWPTPTIPKATSPSSASTASTTTSPAVGYGGPGADRLYPLRAHPRGGSHRVKVQGRVIVVLKNC